MSIQAPTTRTGMPLTYGLQDRIRQLMAQRQVEPVDRPVDELAPFRTDETQRIVRNAPPDEPPTADDIVREDSPRTLGGLVGPVAPAAPAFPQTPAERVAVLRRQLQPQVNALRARAKAGPVMTIDGEPEPDIELPDPITGFRPQPAELSRKPKPGATQTGGYYVAPGRADEAGRAVGKATREEREKKEKAAADQAENERLMAEEDAKLDRWAAGDDGIPGTPDDRLEFEENPETGELEQTGRLNNGPDNIPGTDDDSLDEHGRPNWRPQGLGQLAWKPAAPGTGYRGRQPGQGRRIGATDAEREVPMTDRRLPDEAGNRPPMLPGRGQSVVRDGGMSPRAPQQGIIDNIPPHLLTSQPPRDQGLFFQWREAMKQLAAAAGVNVAAFEDEEDLVRAGAAIAKQNERMSAPVKGATPDADGAVPSKYERRITSTGAPVFVPSDAMREQGENARRRASARQFVDQHKPDEQTGLAIITAADAGQWDEVDRLVKGARAARRAGTAQAAMDQGRLRGQTQQMMNPRIAPAMFHQSIMAQPNARGVGQVITAWSPVIGSRGVAAGGSMMMQADAQDAAEREAAANRASAEKIANAKKDEDGLDNYMAKVNSVLVNSPDVITAINQLQTINAAASLSANPLVKPENVEYQTVSDVSRHWIRTGRGPDNVATNRGLKILHDKILGDWVHTDKEKAEFFRRAEVELGVPQEYSRQWLERGGR